MAQLTIRLDDELAVEVRAQAEAAGLSINGWVVALLAAAVDPISKRPRRRVRARGSSGRDSS